MLKKAALLFALPCALALGGCATVLNGTNVDYTAESKPEGATIKFSNGGSCTTPCKLEQRRKDDLRADITLEGYKPTYVLIQSKLGGSAFGNILLGGGGWGLSLMEVTALAIGCIPVHLLLNLLQ